MAQLHASKAQANQSKRPIKTANSNPVRVASTNPVDIDQQLKSAISTYDKKPYFDLLDLHFKDTKALAKYVLDSYHDFANVVIPDVLYNDDLILSQRESNGKIYRHRLLWHNCYAKPPMNPKTDAPIYPIPTTQQNLGYYITVFISAVQLYEVIDVNTGNITTTEFAKEDNFILSQLPCMIKSNYCNLIANPQPNSNHSPEDAGGYFVVNNGNEKLMVTVNTQAPRNIYVFARKEANSLVYYATCKSRNTSVIDQRSNVVNLEIKKDNSLMVNNLLFMAGKDISVFILMRALGLETDEQIINAIVDREMEPQLYNVVQVYLQNTPSMTRDDAAILVGQSLKLKRDMYTTSITDPDLIAENKRKHTIKILTTFFLPHVKSQTTSTDANLIHKAYFLAYMIKRLLTVQQKELIKTDPNVSYLDDKDALYNKRFDTPGYRLALTFINGFTKLKRHLITKFNERNSDIHDNPINVINAIKPDIIERLFRQSLSKGKFDKLEGVAQNMNRINHFHWMSTIRRIATIFKDDNNKITKPRQLHNTAQGAFCPCETPVGKSTGLIRNASLTAYITVDCSDSLPVIERYLKNNMTPIDLMDSLSFHRKFKLLINNNIVGVLTKNPNDVYQDLRQMRFNNTINRYISCAINWQAKEFRIFTDAGRIMVPYITVVDGRLSFKPSQLQGIRSWEHFLQQHPGVIEYVSKEEEENIMLAYFPFQLDETNRVINLKPVLDKNQITFITTTNRYDANNVFTRYTHCHIHPSMMFGMITTNTPFSTCNQPPRMIFQYSQTRSSMGVILDYLERSMISYNLAHSMIPIVRPRGAKYTKAEAMPNGENLMVLIAPLEGYNQEDSIGVNQSAVDKGLLYAETFKNYQPEPHVLQNGKLTKPNEANVLYATKNYNKLNEDGFAPVETILKKNDVVMGITIPKETINADDKSYIDKSVVYKSNYVSVVDKIFRGINDDGYQYAKMRLRSPRPVEIGDKCCSRAGQKGVVGAKYHRADLPTTKDGLIPSIIINPNAFPKRMTIGQLEEGLAAKMSVRQGKYYDATAFSSVDIDQLVQEASKVGVHDAGKESMVNGRNGKHIENKLFFTPVYYQRLKQMSVEKIHARGVTGNNNKTTGQPTEGKITDGGGRFGEMERDTVIAHGAAKVLEEKFKHHSDPKTLKVCTTCQSIAHKDPNSSNTICPKCSIADIKDVFIPQSAQIFMEEMLAGNNKITMHFT